MKKLGVKPIGPIVALIVAVASLSSSQALAQMTANLDPDDVDAPGAHQYFGLVEGNYLRSDATAGPVDASAWLTLSESLVDGLKGDDDAIKAAAMRLIIQYRQLVDVSDAVFELVGIYRNHENTQMRQMAVVAIGATGDEWAIEFLHRSLEYEESDVLQRTIRGVLENGSDGSGTSPPSRVKSPDLIDQSIEANVVAEQEKSLNR